MVEWGGWPTLVNPEFEPCKLCESLALLVMDGTGRNGWNTQSLENLEIIYLTSLVSPWSSYPHIHHDNPKKTHVRKQLFVDRLMQALLRATASIADAAKRGRLDKVWISPEGSPGHRGHLNHFAAFGNTCLCWFQPKVSLLTLEQASKMLQFSKKNRFQNSTSDSNLIRFDGDVMTISTWGSTSSSCFSGFSTAIGCSGTSCCVGPIGTKALARGFSVGRTDGAGHFSGTNRNRRSSEVKETTQLVAGNLCDVDEIMMK